MSLPQAWARTVRRFGAERAMVETATGSTCTFQELDARADAWRARHEAELSALEGQAVVFAAANGIGWAEIFLALLKAGAVVVPLDPGEPRDAQKIAASELRAGGWWDGDRIVFLPNARRFRVGQASLIKLTSGSTGRPRPLVFNAAQLLADARQVTSTMGITRGDLNYALIPLGHSYGLGNLALPLVAWGVPLVCGSSPLPHAIAADFERWRPTVFPSVPAIWRALAAAGVAPAVFRSLRRAISAGAPLPPEVAREFAARYGRRLHNFYGSSETGGIAYDRTGAATLAGGVGRALRGVQVMPQRGGRLRVCSSAVFTFQNRRARQGVGCWLPPDRATIDARGGIVLQGRRGAVVKIGGRRVDLGEIAARLKRLAGVRDAWVNVSEGPEPALGAAVASTRALAELRTEFSHGLAPWKVPKRWLALPEFPVTARGKTDTRALRVRLFGKS